MPLLVSMAMLKDHSNIKHEILCYLIKLKCFEQISFNVSVLLLRVGFWVYCFRSDSKTHTITIVTCILIYLHNAL